MVSTLTSPDGGVTRSTLRRSIAFLVGAAIAISQVILMAGEAMIGYFKQITIIKKMAGRLALKWIAVTAMAVAISAFAENSSSAASVAVTVQAGQPKSISPDLFGIFFEDLNYAADGGKGSARASRVFRDASSRTFRKDDVRREARRTAAGAAALP